MTHRHRRCGQLNALALACVTVLAACDSGPSSQPASTTPSTSRDVTAAKAELRRLYAGTYGATPSSAPKPQPGKSAWLISAAQNSAASANSVAAAAQAGEVLGWKTTVFDGKGDPATMLNGVRSAIAAKADGIFMYAIDCSYVTAGLQQAKRAHIPVVAAEAADCSDVEQGAPSLLTYVVHYEKDTPFVQFVKKWGAAQATWLIASLEGKAKVIHFKETDFFTTLATDAGFRDEFAKCAGCKVLATVNFTIADLGPKLQEKAQQALLEHPDANAVDVPYDTVLTSGVAAALRSSGRLGEMKVMGGEGVAPNMDLIREHEGQDAGVGLPTEWEGWSAMDALNRIFNHERPVSSGAGVQVFDAQHNMPESGAYVPMKDGRPIDFAAQYTQAFNGK